MIVRTTSETPWLRRRNLAIALIAGVIGTQLLGDFKLIMGVLFMLASYDFWPEG